MIISAFVWKFNLHTHETAADWICKFLRIDFIKLLRPLLVFVSVIAVVNVYTYYIFLNVAFNYIECNKKWWKLDVKLIQKAKILIAIE